MVASVRQFLPGLAFKAIEVAKAKDMNPDMRIPPYKVTYVYRLMEQMKKFSSKSELALFAGWIDSYLLSRT